MKTAIFFTCLLVPVCALSETVKVDIHKVSDKGVAEALGIVSLSDSPKGLEMKIKISGISPGAHGFHLHENPNCEPSEKDGKMTAANAAGPHYDPQASGKHEGPDGHGHAGDLPLLQANEKGVVEMIAYAPRLKLSEVKNRSLMIHAGGDNYSDTPAPLGGGAGRIACGVIK